MQGSFAQPTRTNGTAITVVVLMHAAGLTALAFSKPEMVRHVFPRTTVVDVKLPEPEKPPPPKPVEQVKQVEPQHVSVITAPEREVVTPVRFDDVVVAEPRYVEPVTFHTKPGPEPVEPAPPPPPEPKKIEAARAKANLASYVSDADYPAAAVRGEEQGTARFLLSVGTNGRVTGCTITGSSGSSALDAATCRIMKQRARFTPARDSAGNPTTDTVSNAIKWVLPE